MMHLVVMVILAVGAWARFDCPPADEIYPCQCHIPPRMTIVCNDITSLSTVRAALKGHFTQTLLRLRLTNVHSFSLPSRALGDLSIRKFDLIDSNIRYIERDAFDGQDSLGSLVLAYGRLEDIPEALQLLSLKSLSLAGNFLMRVQDRSLENLVDLIYLILSDNRISQIDKNAFPENLRGLYISQNLLNTFNGSLQSLEHLEDLYATDNRLTNIKGEFDDLVNLKNLHLDRNHISDISDSFSNLTSITSLSLSGNRIQDVGEALMSLTQLKRLNLSYNYITDLPRRMFEELKDLRVLDLSGNYLNNICPILKPLRSLYELKLSDLGLKNLLPDCFHNMKTLTILDLSYNRLMNIDAISRYPLPSLMYLRLDHNQLTAFRYEMKYAKNLRELDISFNNFSTLKAYYLSNNKHLVTLRMKGNPWKCSELTIAMLKDLEERGVQLHGRPEC